MNSPVLSAVNDIVLLAALPTTRSERTAYCSTTMSCSAPSPLIRLICTVSPSCTLSVGLTDR